MPDCGGADVQRVSLTVSVALQSGPSSSWRRSTLQLVFHVTLRFFRLTVGGVRRRRAGQPGQDCGAEEEGGGAGAAAGTAAAGVGAQGDADAHRRGLRGGEGKSKEKQKRKRGV